MTPNEPHDAVPLAVPSVYGVIEEWHSCATYCATLCHSLKTGSFFRETQAVPLAHLAAQ
jgi:hypothetical protein